MSLLEFNTSSLQNSVYNKQTCVNSLLPRASSTVLYVNDLYKSIVFFNIILKFDLISVDINEQNNEFSVKLQQPAFTSEQFSPTEDPMNFVPYSLTLKNTTIFDHSTIGHVCVSVFDVNEYYSQLFSNFDNVSILDTKEMNDKIQSLNDSFFLKFEKIYKYEFALEYYNRLNDENSKPGIFFLKGPEGIPIEIYKYGHRKNSLEKDKEVEVIEDLGIKINHSMLDFKLTTGDKCLMVDVLAFYVNVLGMRVLDVKHNKNDKFSLYFLGYLTNNTNEENWWMEDKEKKYLPRRAREGYLQLRYYWSPNGFVSNKVETLGYSLEVEINNVNEYLNDVQEKYTDVEVDFGKNTIKDPVGHIYTFIQK